MNKFKSRKFIVWITATVFMIGCFIISIVNNDNQVVNSFTGIWGGISMLYIGGNVAQDFIYKNNEGN